MSGLRDLVTLRNEIQNNLDLIILIKITTSADQTTSKILDVVATSFLGGIYWAVIALCHNEKF